MNQLALDVSPPIVRPTDSKAAHIAARMQEKHLRQTAMRMILQGLAKYDGATSRELAIHLNIDRHLVAKRLSDLRARGEVKNGKPRQCSVSKINGALTWFIANE